MTAETIAKALGGHKAGGGWMAPCPAHDDGTPSLSLDDGDNGKVLVHCHAGCSQDKVVEALQGRGAWPEAKKQIVAEYDYVGADGTLVFQVVRYEPKDFRQRRPDGMGGWIWNAHGVKPLPYNLQCVQKAIAAGETIHIVEGEKDVLSARKIGVTATTNSGGAGKWKPEHAPYFKGARVVVIPDADDVGREHARRVAASLQGIASAVTVVELPRVPVKGDLSDWITAGGTRAELEVLAGLAQAATAVDPGPPGLLGALQREMRAKEEATKGKFSKPDVAEVVQHLAALSQIEYDQQRETAAKLLNCRVTTLDEQVKGAREVAVAAATDRAAVVQDDQPWPSEVDGAELLDALRTVAQRFLVLPRDGDNVIALWTLFTHCIDAVSVAPILALLSPEKRCGKTTTLDLLTRLSCRALSASNITPAALFRAVEKWTPTLLIDEGDSFLRDRDELRGILNSGHTRASAFVLRAEGDDHQPVRFSTWSPKAIALIGQLPDTLQDRSIALTLRRKLPSERVERLRHANAGDFETLRRKCARWARDNAHKLRASRPAIPETLNDRAADSWEPLLAIADVCGGRWPQLARETACSLSGADAETDSVRVELLRDLQAAFTEMGPRASSEDLIKALCKDPHSRWSEYGKGNKPLTQRGLAKLLEPFEVHPRDIRFSDGKVRKGYEAAWLADAFERYIPHQTHASDPQQGNNDEESKSYGSFSSATETAALPFDNEHKSLNIQECCGVADNTDGGAADLPIGRVTHDPRDADSEVL